MAYQGKRAQTALLFTHHRMRKLWIHIYAQISVDRYEKNYQIKRKIAKKKKYRKIWKNINVTHGSDSEAFLWLFTFLFAIGLFVTRHNII